MKNPITNLELFEGFELQKLFIPSNSFKEKEDDYDDESNYHDCSFGVNTKQFLFNLNEKETRLFYVYYYEKIHNKYNINHDLSFSGIVVFFGFVLYCYNANYEGLKNKLLLYFKENLYESYHKDFFLLLFDSLNDFKNGKELDKDLIQSSIQLLPFDEDEKGLISPYNDQSYSYDASSNDIFLNSTDFFFDILDNNDDFLINFDSYGFETTRKYKILSFEENLLSILKQSIATIEENSNKKYFDFNKLLEIDNTISEFLKKYDFDIPKKYAEIIDKNFIVNIKGYLDCLLKIKKVPVIYINEFKEKLSYKINQIEENRVSEDLKFEDDYDYNDDFKYSLNDNRYYDPDSDFDQQHPDFDF